MAVTAMTSKFGKIVSLFNKSIRFNKNMNETLTHGSKLLARAWELSWARIRTDFKLYNRSSIKLTFFLGGLAYFAILRKEENYRHEYSQIFELVLLNRIDIISFQEVNGIIWKCYFILGNSSIFERVKKVYFCHVFFSGFSAFNSFHHYSLLKFWKNH